MKCRHRPNAVLIEICEPVLGNWPQSVLGKQGCSPLGPGTVKEHSATSGARRTNLADRAHSHLRRIPADERLAERGRRAPNILSPVRYHIIHVYRRRLADLPGRRQIPNGLRKGLGHSYLLRDAYRLDCDSRRIAFNGRAVSLVRNDAERSPEGAWRGVLFRPPRREVALQAPT